MRNLIKTKTLFALFFLLSQSLTAQENNNNAGYFSLGARSTINAFDSDGFGLGSGGQFRIQLSNRVNTDWFADYISINSNNEIRSEYYHIGWSVLFYPFENLQYPKLLQPYIVAGHCFDYNKKTLMSDENIFLDRWGSAVQAGLGTHFNLSEKFDISFTCQYMIHLTKEIDPKALSNNLAYTYHSHSTLEGHLLSTISLNYKIFRLWKR
jgi:hypothetical protein